MSKTTQLHEILAVENGLAETANRIQKDTTKTLLTKESIFKGLTKSHIIFKEEDQHLVQATETKEVESTAIEQLLYAENEIARYWDATFQKEEANQRAKADIVIDNKILIKDVPSIVLLSFEKKLTSLLGLYNALPTLDASKAWEEDTTYAKHGVYRTKHDRETQQTVTIRDFKEISPATKEHKAQIAEISTTNVVGKYIIAEFSGATTSLDKAEKIQRLTALIRAVKTARQRANNTEVNTKLKIGDVLMNFING